MSSTRTVRPRSVILALLAVVTAWTTVGSAEGQGGAGMTPQAAPPARFVVTVTHVKPEMLGAYEDLIRNDGNAALKKAGVPWRWTLANSIGGPAYVRISVQPVPNFAQFDQPAPLVRGLGAEGAALYAAKLRTMVASSEMFIETPVPAISIQSNSATPPVFLQVQTMQVLPGKGPEFTSIMSSDYIPHYRKLGVKDYWVNTITFGGPQGTYVLIRPMAKYAEVDQGPLLTQAVGAEAAAKINARRAALTAGSQIVYYRYVPELSYGMPAASK